MRRALIGLLSGFAVVGVLATPSAYAHSHFSFYFGTAPVVVAPPVYVQPAPVVVAPPFYGYGAPVYYGGYGGYWQPGYYGWAGYERRWVPGRWVRGHNNWNRGWGRGYDNRGWVRDRGWRR